MSTEVVMPRMGETVDEGTVNVWHRAVGDQVTEGEPLLEIGTDKVDTDIPAPASGTLAEIRVGPGRNRPGRHRDSGDPMTTVTYREAVARAIAQEMRRDDRVVFLGEDVAAAGGVFKATVGLLEEFGPQRVRDTPISEQAILGAAMGAAMTGLRPIAEIMFSDFFAVCWDLVANEIAKSRYMSDGQVSFPLVIRCANGAGVRFGAQHSQSVENWAMAVPGLKVVAPSQPAAT